MSEKQSSSLAIRVQNTGQVYTLGRTPLTIGRRPENTIVLPDALVSRQHARIEWGPEGPMIHDLGSTHGTYVNGRRVSGGKLLQPGYMLRLGNTILEVESVGQAASSGVPVRPPAPRARSAAPGLLLVAVVAVGLVAGLALLLGGGLFRSDAGEGGTVLPVDAQVEETALPTLAPTEVEALAEAETPLPAPAATSSLEPPTTEPTAQPTAVPATAVAPTTVPQPTATPTAIPTKAPPPTPTSTPTPAFPAPVLVAPTEDQARGLRGQVTFSWSYPRALNPGEGFQVLIWKEGQEHNGAAGLTQETQQTIDLDGVLPGRGGSGDYFWTVVVRRDAPGVPLLSPESQPRRLNYEAPALLPSECATFDCNSCTIWSGDPRCSQCNCL